MSSMSLGRRVSRLRGEARQREIDAVLKRWRASDLSQVRFCKENGISTQTLRRWRLAAPPLASSAATPKPLFLEVQAPAAEAFYEIVLASGVCVRVPPGFDDTDVSRLLAVAASC